MYDSWFSFQDCVVLDGWLSAEETGLSIDLLTRIYKYAVQVNSWYLNCS